MKGNGDFSRSHWGLRHRRKRIECPGAPFSTARLSGHFRLMYFCYGYCIDVYLDWFPKYLNDHRGFSLTQVGFYASLPMIAGAAGDLAGGSLSDRYAKTGAAWSQ